MSELRTIEEDTYKLFATADKQSLVLLPTDYIYHPVELSVENISYLMEKAIFPYDDAALPKVQTVNNTLLVNGVEVFPTEVTRADVIAEILSSLAVLKHLDTRTESPIENVSEQDVYSSDEYLDDVDDYNIPLDDDIEYYIPIIDVHGNETEWSFSQDRWNKLVNASNITEAAEIIARELDNINIVLRENREDNIKVIKNFILTCAPKEDFVSDVVDFVNNHA
jgi:hypothetical protein